MFAMTISQMWFILSLVFMFGVLAIAGGSDHGTRGPLICGVIAALLFVWLCVNFYIRLGL